MTDPIADMLTQIRNALAVKKQGVVLPFSKMKLKLAEILKKEGYIQDYHPEDKTPQRRLKIILKYTEKGIPAIKELSRISKSGQRVYKGYQDLKRVKGGLGTAIVSTSRGLMTDQEARKRKLGGELICEVF